MHARTRRAHAPKPKLGAICIVSWRGREPSRTPRTSPHRRLRRTPNAFTRTFGHSSARSNRRDAAREASCTSIASSVFDLAMAVSLPRNQLGPPPALVLDLAGEDKANMIRAAIASRLARRDAEEATTDATARVSECAASKGRSRHQTGAVANGAGQ